jgi:tRNA A37 threonylcarbamoyladenosine synthetase subunit TsaC/SUA5/YrdC
LGCDITNTKALERIAKIKVKLEKANFSFICSDLSNISDYVRQIDTATFKLLKELAGPYTFILPGNIIWNSKRKQLGIRVPDNCFGNCSSVRNPIVSTSIRDEDDVIEYTHENATKTIDNCHGRR